MDLFLGPEFEDVWVLQQKLLANNLRDRRPNNTESFRLVYVRVHMYNKYLLIKTFLYI